MSNVARKHREDHKDAPAAPSEAEVKVNAPAAEDTSAEPEAEAKADEPEASEAKADEPEANAAAAPVVAPVKKPRKPANPVDLTNFTPEPEKFTLGTARAGKGNSKFSFIETLEVGQHIHFPFAATAIQSSVGAINQKLKGAKHFRIVTVGDNDPKGKGCRVQRDK